jgi:hypothetical protein
MRIKQLACFVVDRNKMSIKSLIPNLREEQQPMLRHSKYSCQCHPEQGGQGPVYQLSIEGHKIQKVWVPKCPIIARLPVLQLFRSS